MNKEWNNHQPLNQQRKQNKMNKSKQTEGAIKL